MDCVILVGGEGTRLRPLTYNTPKQMLKVAGVTIIDRVLNYLSKNDVDRAVLSLGYKPDKFLKAYPNSKAYGIELIYAVEPEPLDTAGAIGFAARFAGFNSRFVVVNGDVLTDLSVFELVKFHESSKGLATIALTPVEDPSRFGVVPTDSNGKVIAFIEKPDAKTAPTNYINAGTYVLENEVLSLIAADQRVSIERETFPLLADEGKLYAMQTDDYWLDLGTPQSLITATVDILSLRHHDDFLTLNYSGVENSNWVAEPCTVPEGVSYTLTGKGIKFSSDAKVNLTAIGDNCFVGSNSNIESSLIGDSCNIFSNVNIQNSIIGNSVTIADDVTIVDSVIGDTAQVDKGHKLIGQRFGS